MRTAGEREAGQRRFAVVEELIAAASGEPAARGLDPQIEIDAGDGRLRRVLPGGEVLLPGIPRLLLQRPSLEAVVDGEPEREARRERHGGEGRETEQTPPQRRRLQPVDRADGVRLAPAESLHGDG